MYEQFFIDSKMNKWQPFIISKIYKRTSVQSNIGMQARVDKTFIKTKNSIFQYSILFQYVVIPTIFFQFNKKCHSKRSRR